MLKLSAVFLLHFYLNHPLTSVQIFTEIVIIIIIIIILFARETVQITVQQSKTWHDNQAGRLRLQLPFCLLYTSDAADE